MKEYKTLENSSIEKADTELNQATKEGWGLDNRAFGCCVAGDNTDSTYFVSFLSREKKEKNVWEDDFENLPDGLYDCEGLIDRVATIAVQDKHIMVLEKGFAHKFKYKWTPYLSKITKATKL